MKLYFLLHMLNSGKIRNWRERAITINFGTLNKVPLADLKTLADDPSNIETVLRRLFVSYRCVWAGGKNPDAMLVRTHLKRLAAEVQEVIAETFGKSTNPLDQEIATQIKELANLASDAAQSIRWAHDSDMKNQSWTETARMIGITLARLRKKCFPLVDFLAQFIPEHEGNNLCDLVFSLLDEGKTSLIREYDVPFHEVADVVFEIE